MKKPILKSPFSKLFAVLFFTAIYSCKKSSIPEPQINQLSVKTASDQLTNPVCINLFPGQSKAGYSRRIYLPVMQVGSSDVKLKMMFDTGSEGIVLQAKSILAPALIADTGIVITDKDSLVSNGITVTRTKLSASYGKDNARTFYGNIAYATFKIGDDSGAVKTQRMPFLLIYKGVDNKSLAVIPVDPQADGIAGVYSSGTPLKGLVTKRSDLKGPFSYLNLIEGLHAGFKLSQLSLVDWDKVTSYTDSPGQSLLSVGINDQSRVGFVFQAQSLKTSGSFSPNLAAMVSLDGKPAVAKSILLDTGTSNDNTIYTDVASETTMDTGTTVSFSTAQGYTYSYINDMKRNVTKLHPLVSNPSRDGIYSINFFYKNSYLLDFNTHEIGVKAE
ncbi:hypothetical protein TH53_22810 [Pedobacter lusitanus]|uniref:Uncharacterized protein n=1 Tax=Pedobacter lusitanus TaxID=1503925 RepID=A0A0D0F0C2_9SPHI|nr:hypothetical protein [Pedobacter lusitanus]KIO75078.1 hypothetical protein TH53_22810 [Pedobacter lusitanus]